MPRPAPGSARHPSWAIRAVGYPGESVESRLQEIAARAAWRTGLSASEGCSRARGVVPRAAAAKVLTNLVSLDEIDRVFRLSSKLRKA